MRETLRPSDELEWQSARQSIGNWNFYHRAYLYCDLYACSIDAGLGIEKNRAALVADAGQGFPLVFSQSQNANHSRLVMRPPYAGPFAAALGRKAFRDAEGALRRVWVDYGNFEGKIQVRGRTEVVCQPEGGTCEIETQVIAYVPYDEHHPCGYLSQAEMTS